MLEKIPKGAIIKGGILKDDQKKVTRINAIRISAIVLPVDVAIMYLLFKAPKISRLK
jgi:hypothetical protein